MMHGQKKTLEKKIWSLESFRIGQFCIDASNCMKKGEVD